MTTEVEATAYDVDPRDRGTTSCLVYTATTASGMKAREGVIAVDPQVFPFGTRFSIGGYGNGVAGDTGGLISGHRVDLAMEHGDPTLRDKTTCGRALAWGRRNIRVAYLYPYANN